MPHTRPVPILGTESRSGLLKGGVLPGPEGILRVPSAAISIFDIAVAKAGIPAVGYFAQIPHYVSGEYPQASVELLRALGRHLDVELDVGRLPEDARLMRVRLDNAAAREETTKTYVERLEALVDESRLPSGDDLISEIERFLREGGPAGRQREAQLTGDGAPGSYPRIVILGRDTCEDTTRSRRHLDSLGIPYEYFRVDREPTADEWIRSLNDDVWVTPTILIGDPQSPSQILREPSNEELEAAVRPEGAQAR